VSVARGESKDRQTFTLLAHAQLFGCGFGWTFVLLFGALTAVKFAAMETSAFSTSFSRWPCASSTRRFASDRPAPPPPPLPAVAPQPPAPLLEPSPCPLPRGFMPPAAVAAASVALRSAAAPRDNSAAEETRRPAGPSDPPELPEDWEVAELPARARSGGRESGDGGPLSAAWPSAASAAANPPPPPPPPLLLLLPGWFALLLRLRLESLPSLLLLPLPLPLPSPLPPLPPLWPLWPLRAGMRHSGVDDRARAGWNMRGTSKPSKPSPAPAPLALPPPPPLLLLLLLPKLKLLCT